MRDDRGQSSRRALRGGNTTTRVLSYPLYPHLAKPVSISVMGAVIKRYGGKPHLKLTLLILADRADDDGVCWPSYDELAGKLSCSRRSAINNVNDLIASGLVEIVAKGGRFTDPRTKKHRGFSNRFVINVSAIETMPLLYLPRGSYPQASMDACSALQNMGEVGFTHPSTARVKPTSPGTSDKTSSSTVTGEMPVESLVRGLAQAWRQSE